MWQKGAIIVKTVTLNEGAVITVNAGREVCGCITAWLPTYVPLPCVCLYIPFCKNGIQSSIYLYTIKNIQNCNHIQTWQNKAPLSSAPRKISAHSLLLLLSRVSVIISSKHISIMCLLNWFKLSSSNSNLVSQHHEQFITLLAFDTGISNVV